MADKKEKHKNKLFFYGLPLLALITIFASLFFVILPTIQVYVENTKYNKIIVANNNNVNQSSQNLRAALAKKAVMDEYDQKLIDAIPKNPKLGDLLKTIQEKADDFNLEADINVAKGTSKTSYDTIAKKDPNDKSIFESINSGEIEFVPKNAQNTDNLYSILISMEVAINGRKTDFQNFLTSIKDVNPIINLTLAEYSESSSEDVSVILRFESYALDTRVTSNTPKTNVTKLDESDTSVYSEIPVEQFVWNQESYDAALGIKSK